MSGVATVCSAPIVAEVRGRGQDPTRLIAGLGLRLEDVERPRGRVPWPSFVVFAKRAAELLGPETLEELAAAATVDSVPRPVRRLLARLPDSRPLFRLAPRWWGPRVFRGTRGRCEPLPDGRLREVVRILPGHAPCPEFLSGIRGTLRAMPRLLGQAEALVTFEHDGREGEYIITPPPPRTSAPRLEALRRLGHALARGGAGDRDALHQDIVRLIAEQPGVAGVRLAAFDQGGSVREAVAGSTAGAPAESRPLRIADRRIGKLELWCAGRGVPVTVPELVPWIAFAVEYARSRARIAQLVDLLVQDVRDWQRMERRLQQLAGPRGEDPQPGCAPAMAPPGDREAIGLADFVHGLGSRLRVLTGDQVQLVLRCAEGLPPVPGDRRELESLVTDLVEILRDIGSEEIRVEARGVAEGGGAAARCADAELLVRGRGGELDTASRGRLQAALDLARAGRLLTVVGEGEPASAVAVRIPLPLPTPPAGGPLH